MKSGAGDLLRRLTSSFCFSCNRSEHKHSRSDLQRPLPSLLSSVSFAQLSSQRGFSSHSLLRIAGIIDLDTPWFWFNASWTTTNSVVYKRTFCKVSGLDYGEHVVAMGGVAADAPQFISFDYALTSDTSNGSSIVWG